MDSLRAVVERITYQNTQNGYTVLRCRVRGYPDLVTVVGTIPDVHVGSVLTVSGSWRQDPKYGRQFSASRIEESLPATAYGMEKYLGSGLIRGIGPKYASLIVRHFGRDTLDVIEKDPERLMEVPGIGKVRVDRIRKSWEEQREIRNIMLFLQSHDVSTSHAAKIYRTYGNDSIHVVTENPYRLADDIWGIGFRTADTIARKLGFDSEKYTRLRSGLLYALNRLSESGHCYAQRNQLLDTASELLEVKRSLLEQALQTMMEAQDVITEEDAIWLPPFYYAETGAALRLHTILRSGSRTYPVTGDDLRSRISLRTGVRYDGIQMQAIEQALQSRILILTGGPGTGKTTTTLGILTAFLDAGASVLLAAPTGRAARRLSETTGMEAKTIHRLLEYQPAEGYQRNETNPLSGDVLILDECSMIDLMLFYSLLKAVPDSMTLLFVGDVDQLPSVGPGNVLRDLIDSGCFPVVRLTRIFRQAQESRIITNAHLVNQGKMPDLRNGTGTDFFFVEREDPEQAAQEITELVRKKLPGYYHIPPEEIQVLTPMQRGVVGAVSLNSMLQAAVNPGSDGLTRSGTLYRKRDKVMQIRNNYSKEVFNGDIGTVTQVDPEEQCLTVQFDQRNVIYEQSELDELVLSYAATIHKSQGSGATRSLLKR